MAATKRHWLHLLIKLSRRVFNKLDNSNKQEISKPEALEKLRYFCAYQERSEKQVLKKMNLILVPTEWQNEIISTLKADNYLNEDRFKKSFVKGKSTLKGWGPNKIQQHLQFETGASVNVSCLLNPEDFQKAIAKLVKDLEKKFQQLSAKKDKDLAGKLIRFCLSRGFSFEDAKSLTFSLTKVEE